MQPTPYCAAPPPPLAPKKKPAVLAVLGALVGVVLGGLLAYAGTVEVTTELRLREGAATVEARVRDSRIMTSSRTGDSYELQYSFELPGSSTVFSRTDATGRKDLWASVPEGDWQAARKSKKLSVSYLPADPWNNRPTHADEAPLGDAIAGVVLGLVFAVPCLLLLIFWLRRAAAR